MNFLSKRNRLLLYLLWLAVQLFWLQKFGIYRDEEAVVYINIASRIASGDWNHSIHYWLYAGYITPLVIIKWIGLPFEWMYLVQLALSFIAFVCFIRMLNDLKLSIPAIICGSILFATCPVFQSWNSHLYTDGYFGSITVIALHAISRFFADILPNYWKLMGLLVYACFVRPVGFLLIPVALLYGWIKGEKRSRLIFPAVWLILFCLFVLLSLRNGKDFFYPNHNLDLNIICGFPSELRQYEKVPYSEGISITGYFLSNPGMTFRLFKDRLFTSLWMTRPYFSTFHNMIMGATCTLYYILALLGTVYAFRKKILNYLYIFLGIGIWLVPNILLCADWHNRFMVPFFPFLLVVATFGIELLLSKGKVVKPAT